MGQLRDEEIEKIRYLLTDRTLKNVQRYYLRLYLSSLMKTDKRGIGGDTR